MPDAEPSSPYSLGRPAWLAACAVAVIAFALRVAIIMEVPVMPDGDSYTRLGRVDELVIHSWLPLYQLTLRMLALLTVELQAFRVFTAAQGAIGAAAVALLVGAVRGPPSALVAGLAVAVCPAHVLPATALYQEPLFVALLAGGLLGAARGKLWGAVLLLLGTWTRYEGWAAALIGVFLLPRRLALIPLLGPAAWLCSSGLSSAGIDFSATTARAVEQIRTLRALIPYWVGWPFIAVGVLGAWRGPLDRIEKALIAFAVIDLVSVAMFRPFSPSDNARQLVIPTLAVAVLAGRLAAGGGPVRVAAIIAAIALPLPGVVAGIQGWDSREMEVRRAAQGEAVAARVRTGERMLVLSPGRERWPGLEPDGCLFLGVWARLPREQVLCETEIPVEDIRGWLDAANVAFVVVLEDGLPERRHLLMRAKLIEVSPGVYLSRT